MSRKIIFTPRFIKKLPLIGKAAYRKGLPPGTPVFIGEKKVEEVKISYIDYDEERYEENDVEEIEKCFPLCETSTITWINVNGLHRVDIIEKLGENVGLHPLVLADIVNTQQRPKMEEHENYLYVVLKMLTYNEETSETQIEQVSLILGKNYVISFQEREGDIFENIRERIRNGKGRIRRMGPDYLAYSIVDAVVDHYFIILEKIGEKIEQLENMVIQRPTPEALHGIYKLKREVIILRRSIWPLREVVNKLEREESSLVQKPTHVFLRDVYDHAIQVIDTVETYRDILSGIHDTYLSSLSTRMNEVMKVLTIIATIFIPLTFIAGIYGMNFEFMPELKWRGAYFAIWGLMAFVAIVMILFFKRKKWW